MGGEFLSECFAKSFLNRKENPAITFLRDGRVETQISYLELEQDANRMANTFLATGVEKGDRVILLIKQEPQDVQQKPRSGIACASCIRRITYRIEE